jgi:hypothetical protein
LADANGLQADASLVAGSSLTVPEVKTSSNDASTFKPYNPSEITGPTTPSLPYIAPPDQGCGTIGLLIMVAVAVAVAVATGPAATTFFQSAFAGGAVAGAASVAASSAIGSALDVASFSWRGVAAGALSGAITAGIAARFGSVADALSGASPSMAKAAGLALANAGANYAGQKLAGTDASFSWKSIAASTVSSLVSGKVAGKVNFDSQIANDFAVGMAGGMVSAAVREALNEGGRANYMTVVADAFGNALGNRLGAQINAARFSSSTAPIPEDPAVVGSAQAASGWDRFATTYDQGNASGVSVLDGILARFAGPGEGGGGGTGGFGGRRDVLGDRARMVQRLEGLGAAGADTVNIADSADYQAYISMYGHLIGNTGRGYAPTLPTVEVSGAQQAVADNLGQGVGWGVYSRAAIINATATDEDRRANYNRWLTQTYAATRGNVGPAGKTFLSDEQFRYYKRQDDIALFKFATAPMIAAGSGALAVASPLFGAGLSVYGAYRGVETLSQAETAGDYALGSLEIAGSAFGLGFAARQLQTARGLREAAWMPLGIRGQATALTHQTKGWQDFGVVPNYSKMQFSYAGRAANSATSARASLSAADRELGFVFRGDSRSPAVIFEQGFQPRGEMQDLRAYASSNEPSIFVGTSKSPNVARLDFASEGDFVYTIRGRSEGLDVNSILGRESPFPHELEVVFKGGISSQSVLGARQVGTNGNFIGPFILNPSYLPR